MSEYSLQVTEKLVVPNSDVVINKPVLGKWLLYKNNGTLLLHEKLSVEVASSLCIWEDINSTTKVTYDLSGRVLGVAHRAN